MKTDEELRTMAIDILGGRIFTNFNMPPGEAESMLGHVFMPILLMTKEQLEAFAKEDVGMIYEYMDKAGPRSFNGYPIFFSLQQLTVAEAEKVNGYIQQLREFQKGGSTDG